MQNKTRLFKNNQTNERTKKISQIYCLCVFSFLPRNDDLCFHLLDGCDDDLHRGFAGFPSPEPAGTQRLTPIKLRNGYVLLLHRNQTPKAVRKTKQTALGSSSNVLLLHHPLHRCHHHHRCLCCKRHRNDEKPIDSAYYHHYSKTGPWQESG